jgi:membrane protein implicated in regulation of membrane protease activity
MRKPYRERAAERDRKRFESMKKAGKYLLYFFLFEVACVLFLAWSLLWDSWLELFIFVLAMLLPLMLGISFGMWAVTSRKAVNIERDAMENRRVMAEFVRNPKGAVTSDGR